MIYMCLCMMLAPLLKPELKNMKALRLRIVIQLALKSSISSGSICLANSLVITMTCLSHTENLLKIRLCVSVISSMNAPFSNGSTNGFFPACLLLVTSGLNVSLFPLGFCASIFRSFMLKLMFLSGTVYASNSIGLMLGFPGNIWATL
jgi:hypothetical protein